MRRAVLVLTTCVTSAAFLRASFSALTRWRRSRSALHSRKVQGDWLGRDEVAGRSSWRG